MKAIEKLELSLEKLRLKNWLGEEDGFRIQIKQAFCALLKDPELQKEYLTEKEYDFWGEEPDTEQIVPQFLKWLSDRLGREG